MAGSWRLGTSARVFKQVTPSDAVDLPNGPCRALYVSYGDVTVVGADGDVALFAGASGVLPISVRRVRVTGTTAPNIVALY